MQLIFHEAYLQRITAFFDEMKDRGIGPSEFSHRRSHARRAALFVQACVSVNCWNRSGASKLSLYAPALATGIGHGSDGRDHHGPDGRVARRDRLRRWKFGLRIHPARDRYLAVDDVSPRRPGISGICLLDETCCSIPMP